MPPHVIQYSFIFYGQAWRMRYVSRFYAWMGPLGLDGLLLYRWTEYMKKNPVHSILERKYRHIDWISSLAAPEVVQVTTSGAANDNI